MSNLAKELENKAIDSIVREVASQSSAAVQLLDDYPQISQLLWDICKQRLHLAARDGHGCFEVLIWDQERLSLRRLPQVQAALVPARDAELHTTHSCNLVLQNFRRGWTNLSRVFDTEQQLTSVRKHLAESLATNSRDNGLSAKVSHSSRYSLVVVSWIPDEYDITDEEFSSIVCKHDLRDVESVRKWFGKN